MFAEIFRFRRFDIGSLRLLSSYVGEFVLLVQGLRGASVFLVVDGVGLDMYGASAFSIFFV